MKTTKAYLAGLGTAVILIASAFVALMLGTGFVAVDNAPALDNAPYPLERVVVEDARPARSSGPRPRG